MCFLFVFQMQGERGLFSAMQEGEQKNGNKWQKKLRYFFLISEKRVWNESSRQPGISTVRGFFAVGQFTVKKNVNFG